VSVLVTEFEASPDFPGRLRRQAAAGVQNRLRPILGASPNLIYRELRASDVLGGLTELLNPVELVPTEEVEWFLFDTKPLAEVGVALLGFWVPSDEPSPITELHISRRGRKDAIFQVGRLAAIPERYSDQAGQKPWSRTGWFSEPIYFDDGESIGIGLQVNSPVPAMTARFGLIGVVGEEYGKTVAPKL